MTSCKVEYIHAETAVLAKVNSTGTYYYHQDHLSNRMVTNSSGGVVAEMGHFPFGESWYNATNDKLYFTTYEYDAESGNHYAMARYHISRLGRLSSPDPVAGSIADPQSFNRYSYSINDPANITDPSGAIANPCDLAQGQPKNQSQQASGDGPSDSSADDADPPQQNNCSTSLSQYLDEGVFLDGGDITDNSGGMSTAFPAYGGAIMAWQDLGQYWVSVKPGWFGFEDGYNGIADISALLPLGLNWPSWPSGPGNDPASGAQKAIAKAIQKPQKPNCKPNPASATQYAEAGAEAALLTSEFFSGLGQTNQTFGPNSATSQVMAQSAGVQDVLNSYTMLGQTSGLYTFGVTGLYEAGVNPAAQFVGSFRWSIAPTNGGINLTLTNTTSFRSLTYDVGPQWQRGSFPTPMGNIHQTFNIFIPCK
jgi:RHS repeat-associated protein